jgi:hypothetical protein
MLDRLRNPDDARDDGGNQALEVLFIGDRNVGNNLKNGFGENIDLTTMATTAGAMTEAKKNDVVLIYLGGQRGR